MQPPLPSDVKEVFLSYPASVRRELYGLRKLIFQTAASVDGVGPITETLKWGEPAYLAELSRSGSTIRIGWKASEPTQYAMYFNCRTNLVDTFRTLFPDLACAGNRALLFQAGEALPADSVARCVELALTYHLNKRQGARLKRQGGKRRA